MTILTSSIRRIRKSGSNVTLTENAWASWPFTSPSVTGASVNDTSALSLTTFYGGLTMIASDIAGFPMGVHEETATGNQKLKTADTYYLWGRPNPEMTRQSFWEREVADEVRGNAFIFVEKDDIGGVKHIWHLERQRVRVGRTAARQKVYEVDGELPMIDYSAGGEIVHIPNWGDGMVGYDIVKIAAQAIALGLSAEEYAARTFSQGSVPPGILTSEQDLDEKQSEAILAQWQRKRAGGRNWAKIAVLGRGAKFQQLSVDPEKMQLESLRRFQAGEIATLLGIPPHMLGLVDRTTSWGTGIAEQELGYNRRTLQRHLKRFEQAINDALLVRELTNRFVKFDMDGQLRATTLQRYQAYALGYGRWLSANEIRKDEDLPPIEGGDDLLAAVNMVPADQLGLVTSAQPGRAEGGEMDRVMALSGKNGKH